MKRTKEILLPILLVVATLYLGREFFMPIALAILISFLLAPIVRKFERWGGGRIGSVITVTILAFALLAGLGAVVGGQLIDLANKLPSYQTELHKKVSAIKAPRGGALEKVRQTIQDLTTELNADTPKGEPVPASPAVTGYTTGFPKPVKPWPVTIVEGSRNSFDTLGEYAKPVLAPLGTAALVIVFVIFILLSREDLRDRLIHLIGRGHLQTTTRALDEAGHRVSRYLLAQLLVNVSYGFPIGIGLWLIGIPNAILWGLLATLLRFVPYIGAWIASAFPLVLSLAIAPGWTMPAETLALFLVVELVTNNVLEPWLYGTSTGLSTMAVILAAAFWTWLWGAPGLLLATPLTVCIVVIGKYLPQLHFLDVLLGERAQIAPEDRFYQRLLAQDEDEVLEIAEHYLKKHTLAEAYDNVIVPALRLTEEDYCRDQLTDARRMELLEQVANLVTDLGEPKLPKLAKGETPAEAAPEETPAVPLAAIIVPAKDFADEATALMLAKLLSHSGAQAHVVPSKLLASEMVEEAAGLECRNFCVSLTPPGSTRHALYLCKRLRERFPDARIVVGVWGEPEGDEVRTKRFRDVQIDGVFTTLEEMTRELLATAVSVAPEPAIEPPQTRAERKAEAVAAKAEAKAEAVAAKAEAAEGTHISAVSTTFEAETKR
ncbi:MAG TPA: AI-2E family transporter [Chthoniobacteraceae bacterium]|nr:AI-2E family transporter [Chthoniobacteraceae bacterium]